MALLYYDPVFLEHDTGYHPENAERLLPLVETRRFGGLDKHCQRPDWQPAPIEWLAEVHGPDYIQRVADFAEAGGGSLDPDTVVSRRSFHVARMAAGAACDAVRRVVAGPQRQALCLVRPPGHHALSRRAMGFCLFNNVAVAARLATGPLELERVLIVDWDVHHGNGTQDAFWQDERVGFLSIHRWPFYPGTGSADETGGGPGLGTTCNLPVTMGTRRADYLRRFADALDHFAARIRPQLVIVSAGFDSHRLDPVGSLGLETEDFEPLTRYVQQVAHQYAEGRLVCVLEGGYHPQALADSLQTHLQALLDDESAHGPFREEPVREEPVREEPVREHQPPGEAAE